MKPNFFIIGAPKCGTTSLYEYLKTHPNLFLSNPKEPHFFGDHAYHPAAPQKLDDYLSLFDKADPAIHLAVGEASTGYLFSKQAVPEILAFDPKAKFIVMLRNPVDMLLAAHSERIFQGAEDILDFERAWRADINDPASRNITRQNLFGRTVPYAQRGKLGDQLERLYSVVNRDQVLVILFEDFISNTKKSYEEVLVFLGLPMDGRVDFPKSNPHKKVKRMWLHNLLSNLRGYAGVVKAKMGIYRNFGSLGWLLRFNTEPNTKSKISDELKQELKAYFREDVSKLSKLLGRDLSHWVS